MLEMPDLRRRASKKDLIMNTQSGQKTISFQVAINHALCCILSLVLVVGFCPVSALADDQTGKNISDSPAISEDNTANGKFVSSQGEAQDNQALGSEDQLSPSNETEDDEDSFENQTSLSAQSEQTLSAAAQTNPPSLSALVHVQNVGDRSFANVNQSTTIGTIGQSKRLEGITLALSAFPVGMSGTLQYRTHVQNQGWQGWANSGAFSGTKGKALRVEAIQIKLTGSLAQNYDIYYRAHAQNYGWLDWAKNGSSAGTEGFGYRLEALQICILPKSSSSAPRTGNGAYKHVVVQAKGHSQNIGWKTGKFDGITSPITIGVTGKGKRLEAFNITSSQLRGMSYSALVQGVGWQGFRSAGQEAGTTGQSKRIEAVKFKLDGDLAQQYDVYYRAHVANIGWLDWAKNGESAGTEGYSIRLEAIQIRLVKKGSSAPGSTVLPVINTSITNSISLNCGYQTASSVWQSTPQGNIAGTTGQAKALTGMKLSVSSPLVSGGISYRTHVANNGWLSNVSNGNPSPASSKAIQALQIRFTGNLSKYFDIYYQSHVAGYGWMGWTKNGANSGSTGLSKNIEAYRVKIVPKGASAPGSTANSFSDQNGFLGLAKKYAQYINRANKYSSATPWLILVDVSAHRTVVLHGRQGSWSVSKYVSCVTGAPGSPTIRGRYSTTGFKRPSLSTDRRARYCTQIRGGYFFHTILASNGELGHSLSHGCVRLAVNDARWIYNTIPGRTTVVLF